MMRGHIRISILMLMPEASHNNGSPPFRVGERSEE